MPQGLEILIVDDDPIIRSSLAIYFGVHNGFYSAPSLSEARREIERLNHLDVVFLDKSLPDGNGIELIAEIRTKFPRIAILILTGDSNFRSVNECISAGADDYLVKGKDIIQDLLTRLPVVLAAVNTKSTADQIHCAPSVRLPSKKEGLTSNAFCEYLERSERDYIERALHLCHNDVDETARRIGIGRSTLFKKIASLGIAHPPTPSHT